MSLFLYLRPVCLSVVLLLSYSLSAKCIDFSNALKHIGETRCVIGKVFRVRQGDKGVHYLDFCEDYRTCTFTVVIFPGDLRHVGDIRSLQGEMIEIHGDVKEYDGRAEIIASEASQFGRAGVRLQPLPKNFDVEKRGNYSSGIFSHPKSPKASSQKRQPAAMPINIPKDPAAADENDF